MKHLHTFEDFLNESFLGEAAPPSPSEKAAASRKAEESTRELIKATMQKLKDDPENSSIYKAKLDVLNAKVILFGLNRKLAAATANKK